MIPLGTTLFYTPRRPKPEGEVDPGFLWVPRVPHSFYKLLLHFAKKTSAMILYCTNNVECIGSADVCIVVYSLVRYSYDSVWYYLCIFD